MGGHDGSEHLGNMEMFDPLTNKWMMRASMNTKRYDFSVLMSNSPCVVRVERSRFVVALDVFVVDYVA